MKYTNKAITFCIAVSCGGSSNNSASHLTQIIWMNTTLINLHESLAEKFFLTNRSVTFREQAKPNH